MAEVSPSHLGSALALGSVAGMRTFGSWAGLAVRRRVGGPRLRLGLAAAAGGEMLADKHPAIPPRSDPAPLAGRVISGALAGRIVGGPYGAGVGAAGAAATTYASQRARALLGARSPLPDPAIAVLEDVLALGVATAAALPDSSPEGVRPAREGHDAAPRRSRPAACALGLLAAAAGTAALTSVQTAYLSLSGGEPSSAPGDVGRTLAKRVVGQKVPRRRRMSLHHVVHVLYGTAWGAPLGLLVRSRPSGGRCAALGLSFGTAVWGISLVQLRLMGVAPLLWRQPAGSLVSDLAFHLVYGTSTAAIYAGLAG